MIITHSINRKVIPLEPSRDFSVYFTDRSVNIQGNTQVISDLDTDILRITPTVGYNEFDINVSSYYDYSITNNSPGIATISPQGKVSLLQNGIVEFDVITKYGKRSFSRPISSTLPIIQNVLQNYKAGSLAQYFSQKVAEAVSNKTAGDASQLLYTTPPNYNLSQVINGNTAQVGRNVNAIHNGIININATSVTSENNSYRFPAHLISPRHIIQAAHIASSAQFAWIDDSGIWRKANVIASKNITSMPDTVVRYLDAPITGITPFYFLPQNWASYLPSLSANKYLSLPIFTKKPQTDLKDKIRLINMTGPGGVSAVFQAPYTELNPFITSVIGGDSGSGLYAPVLDGGNIRTVLLAAYYTTAGGAFYSNYINEIESAMNSLSVANGGAGNYTLNKVSLSGFNAY